MFEHENGLAPDVMLKKHSAIIQMKNEISANQRKMFNAILYIAAKQLIDEPEKLEFKARFSDIRKYAGLTHETNYKYIKNSLKELQNNNIEYNILEKDKEVEWGVFALLSEVRIRKEDEFIYFAFPPTIQKNIKRPNIYALLNLGIISSLKSKYSISLYELLQDYRKIKRLRIVIEDLKKLMGVGEKQYKIFTMFKQKVLDVAVEEINSKSDLRISYTLEQEGRKYTAVIFKMQSFTVNEEEIQDINRLLPQGRELTEEEQEKQAIIYRLIYYGISEKKANIFYNSLTQDDILSAIKVLENALKSRKIKNPGGYLSVLLSNGATLDSLFDKEQEKQQKTTLETAIKHEKSIIEESELKANFDEYYHKKCENIMDNVTDNDIDSFIGSHRDNKLMTSFMINNNIIDEDLLPIGENILKYPLFISFIKEKYLPYDEEFKQWKKSKGER